MKCRAANYHVLQGLSVFAAKPERALQLAKRQANKIVYYYYYCYYLTRFNLLAEQQLLILFENCTVFVMPFNAYNNELLKTVKPKKNCNKFVQSLEVVLAILELLSMRKVIEKEMMN